MSENPTARRDELREYVDTFDQAWREYDDDAGTVYRDAGWQKSVIQFAERGLPLAQALVFVDQAMYARMPWKYFCATAHRYCRALAEASR